MRERFLSVQKKVLIGVNAFNETAAKKFIRLNLALQNHAFIFVCQKHHCRFAERRGGRRLNRP